MTCDSVRVCLCVCVSVCLSVFSRLEYQVNMGCQFLVGFKMTLSLSLTLLHFLDKV